HSHHAVLRVGVGPDRDTEETHTRRVEGSDCVSPQPLAPAVKSQGQVMVLDSVDVAQRGLYVRQPAKTSLLLAVGVAVDIGVEPRTEEQHRYQLVRYQLDDIEVDQVTGGQRKQGLLRIERQLEHARQTVAGPQRHDADR